MRSGLFGQVLPRLRLSDAKTLASGDCWSLWEAKEDRAFGSPEQLFLLYFDSRASWGIVEQAIDESRKRVALGQRRLYCVVQNSADVARDLARIKKECGAVGAFTVRQLLSQSIGSRIGAAIGEDDFDRLFVDPDIQPIDSERAAQGGTVKAIHSLSQWLKDDSQKGPRLAVLVAKAGIGKTTVARQLFRYLRGKEGEGRFPILVESDQWAKLLDRSSLGLWDVWRESLDVHYTAAIGNDEFELCVEHGLFLPIFDGFDELCTRLGGHFSVNDMLRQLNDLLSDTEGRMLLTTRDAFWFDNLSAATRQEVTHFELLSFNKQQTTKYLENKFRVPSDIPKREVATNILQRISHVAHAGEMPEFRERLTSVPVVIAITAWCADMDASEAVVLKYGTLLSSADPLQGLLLILFERERERRKLLLEPEAQLGLFSSLALHCGDVFSAEQLRLYASMRGLNDSPAQLQALQSHVALARQRGQLGFRFEFLGRYLAAGELMGELLTKGATQQVLACLNSEPRGNSLLVERAVDHLFAHFGENRMDLLQGAWRSVFTNGLRDAQSGLLHIVLKAIEREVGSGPRRERTRLLVRFLGADQNTISGLNVQGVVGSLDFRGLTVKNCSFVNAGFSRCVFDTSTRFVSCTFDGVFEVDDCEAFVDASYEACNFGPRAREAMQLIDPKMVPITPEQIRSTARIALQMFERGMSFKVVPRANSLRGRIAASPIAKDVWDSLEKHQVIKGVDLPGIPNGGLKIFDGRQEEVRLFISNAIATGLLKRSIENLVDQLAPRGRG